MRAFCFAALVAWVLAAVGCKDDGDDRGGAGSSTAGTFAADAGGASGEGSTPDADGGGVSPGVVSERLACKAYLEALCLRRAECGGQSADEAQCFTAGFECPDAVFSIGSTRTLEGTMACAKEVATFSCSKLLNDEVPSCVTPGTRAGGERCMFSSQCESLRCTFLEVDPEVPRCGMCAALVPSGGDCSAPNSECPLDEACDSAKKRCVPKPAAPVIKPPMVSKLGEACPTNLCEEGTSCLIGLSGPGTCQILPGVGESCGRTTGSSEEPSTHVCDPETAYCDTDDRCATLPAVGSKCAVTFDGTFLGGLPTTCGPDVHCNGTICVANAKRGEPCESDAALIAGLSGFCSDGLQCDAATSLCVEIVSEGAACGATGRVCEWGTECEAGTCTWQGPPNRLFEQACSR